MPARLSRPAKMPGFSFSLPAVTTCPVAKATIKEHGDQSVCASCYATRNLYRMPNVKRAQLARLQEVRESLAEDAGDSWVEAMITEIRKVTRTGEPCFRIHDAGDFFNPAYVDAWIRVCTALPDVRFWAPTREYLRPATRAALERLAALPNVSVRPSAVVKNTPAPVVAGLHAGSAVYDDPDQVPGDHYICPASAHATERTCNAHGCRACWTGVTPIAYITH